MILSRSFAQRHGSTARQRLVDLRSDTITIPTPAVRELMSKAALGDDVYGEDPSCNALERRGAELMGKEACAFLTSGTQGNLAAFMAHCDMRGSEIICGDRQHTYIYEQGGSATLAGIHTRVVKNEEDGTMDIASVLKAIQVPDQHYATTKLVSIENTHNMCGGVPLSLEYIRELKRALVNHSGGGGIKLHMDGARACNAAVALGVDLKDVCRDVDTVSLCLSKGLGAPVGSLVAGDAAFIAKVRRAKKALGGGWRKAGCIASAGLHCLDQYKETLQRDHAHAKQFATGLRKLDGIKLALVGGNGALPPTNMVFFQVEPYAADLNAFAKRVYQAGGLVLGGGYGRSANLVRTVFHQNITEEDVDSALRTIKTVLEEA